MAGIRIGGRAIVAPEVRIIPFIEDFSDNPTFYQSIWMAKHGMTPVAAELVQTRWDTSTDNPQICDPMLSPDQSLLAYAVIPANGAVNSVYVIPPDESLPPDEIANSPNAAGTPDGVEISLQPSWHPDSNSLIYRSSIADAVPGPNFDHIYTVDKDGTNGATLFTIQLSAVSPPAGRVYWPQYSPDGSRIAFIVRDNGIFPAPATTAIWTMDADGTNDAEIVTGITDNGTTPFCWMNNSNVIGYYKGFASGEYHSVNDDGTGDSLLWTDPTPWWGSPRLAWLPDDSAMIVSERFAGDPDPKFVLTLVDAGGGATAISPERRWYGVSRPTQPRMFPQDGRIWWDEGDWGVDDTLSSILPDGSDYTVEWAPDWALEFIVGFSNHS